MAMSITVIHKFIDSLYIKEKNLMNTSDAMNNTFL
jgi:hypothetical protein